MDKKGFYRNKEGSDRDLFDIKELRKMFKEIQPGTSIALFKKETLQEPQLIRENGDDGIPLFFWSDNTEEGMYLIDLKKEIENRFSCDIEDIRFQLPAVVSKEKRVPPLSGTRVVGAGQVVDKATGGLVRDPNFPTWKCRRCGALANSNNASQCGICSAPRKP